MNITDITLEDRIKIGKTSITVKRDNKTRGVITNCETFQYMSPRRKQELYQMNLTLNILSKCVLKDNNVFYMYDVSLREFIKTSKYFTESDIEKVSRIEDEVSKIKSSGIPAIEYLR